MPVYDRSYRRWDGELKRRALRFLPIVSYGVRSAVGYKGGFFATMTLRGFMLVSCLPTLVLFLVNWIYWYPPSFLPSRLVEFVHGLTVLRDAQYPLLSWFNGKFLWIYVVLFGSGLIARDRASGALPLYLSRPVTIVDYIVGKVGVIATFVAGFTLVPGLAIWLLGLVADSGEHAWRDSLSILPAILAHGALMILVFALTILAVSSICRKPMFAAIVWFASMLLLQFLSYQLVFALGEPSWLALSPMTALNAVANDLYQMHDLATRAGGDVAATRLVLESLQALLGAQLRPSSAAIWASLVGWCALSLSIIVSVLRRQDVVEAGR